MSNGYDMPFGARGKGKWDVFSGLVEGGPGKIFATVLLLIILIVVMGMMMMMWGLLAFLGTLIILIAMFIIVFNRGATAGGLQPYMFFASILIGLFLIALSLLGLDESLITVDLRAIPGLEFLHNLIRMI